MENQVLGSKIAAALAKAQGAIETAEKSKENPAFSRPNKKSTYADISDVIEVIKKPASENGLSVIFNYKTDEQGVWIQYKLLHSSGENIVGDWLLMFLRDKTAHGFGAAVTYYRRQMLKSIYQIAEQDDDGNEASGVGNGDDAAKAELERIAKAKVLAEAAMKEKQRLANESIKAAALAKAERQSSLVNQDQLKAMFAKSHEHCWTHEQVKFYIKAAWDIESTKDLDRIKYDQLVAAIEGGTYANAVMKLKN